MTESQPHPQRHDLGAIARRSVVKPVQTRRGVIWHLFDPVRQRILCGPCVDHHAGGLQIIAYPTERKAVAARQKLIEIAARDAAKLERLMQELNNDAP